MCQFVTKLTHFFYTADECKYKIISDLFCHNDYIAILIFCYFVSHGMAIGLPGQLAWNMIISHVSNETDV